MKSYLYLKKYKIQTLARTLIVKSIGIKKKIVQFSKDN